MAAAWAQANPAAQTKLERAKRCSTRVEQGDGICRRAYAHRWVKNLDSERSERRVSKANESKFSGAYIGLAFIKRHPATVKSVLKPLME